MIYQTINIEKKTAKHEGSLKQGWARDGTGQSCDILSRSYLSRGTAIRPRTDRDSSPEMSGFLVQRDFVSGTVPQIFVPA